MLRGELPLPTPHQIAAQLFLPSSSGKFWIEISDLMRHFDSRYTVMTASGLQMVALQGEWGEFTAGGPPSSPGWCSNPQYWLVASKPLSLTIELSQRDHRLSPLSPPCLLSPPLPSLFALFLVSYRSLSSLPSLPPLFLAYPLSPPPPSLSSFPFFPLHLASLLRFPRSITSVSLLRLAPPSRSSISLASALPSLLPSLHSIRSLPSLPPSLSSSLTSFPPLHLPPLRALCHQIAQRRS